MTTRRIAEDQRSTHRLTGYRPLLNVHLFLRQTAVYHLLLVSSLALLLLHVRVLLAHASQYEWMPWNLFLAWVPYIASLSAAVLHLRNPRASWQLVLPAAVWLLFLPNAPYLMTDYIHLSEYVSPLPGYDLILLTLFAATGCLMGCVSLRIMQQLVHERVSRRLSWTFAIVVLGLTTIGVYLGRFRRWNSWDLLIHPGMVAHSVPSAGQHMRFLALFAAGWFGCYILVSGRRASLCRSMPRALPPL